MNYCYSGKEPELPAELFPNVPASISASLSNAIKSKLPTNIPAVFTTSLPSPVPASLPEGVPPQAPKQLEAFKQGCERHYKFVENILKRIAANLGNSPSQTDVKIISCIPIDVTDLQQRIFVLEKELEEAKITRKTDYAAIMRQEIVGAHSSGCEPCNSFILGHTPQCHCHLSRKQNYLSKNNSKVDFPRRKQLGVMQVQAEPRKSEKSKFSKKAIKMKLKGKPKETDPFVYYVQANTSPFANLSSMKKSRPVAQIPVNKKKQDDRHKESVTRVVDSIQMKYASELLADFSSSSEYSAPVCRDAAGAAPPSPKRELDVFSGRGKFHNLDNDIKNLCNDATNSSCSKYYDDSLYDLIPVKEKSKDVKKNTCGRKKKEHIDNISRPLIHTNIPEETNYVMNCSFDNQGFPVYNNFRKMVSHQYAKSSKSHKKDVRKRKVTEHNDVLLRKNASCLTIKMTNMECQTTSGENSQLNTTPKMSENAENTLNEIKETLQTVLETVKTNSRIRYSTEKENSALKKPTECARSEVIKQSLKLKPPHESGPIQLFYTPMPFINSSYLNPCMHFSCHPEKMNSKQKDIKSQEKVTEIWKPETEDGKPPIFISTSERDEPTPNSENNNNISDTQPVSEHVTAAAEVIEVPQTKPFENETNESIVTDDDRLSIVEENIPEVGESSESDIEAEYVEEENESEYPYTSEDASVIFSGEKYDGAVSGNVNENLSVYSESTEAEKLIEEPLKEKKLGKIFQKVAHFFKSKSSKSDKLSNKEEKRKKSNNKSRVTVKSGDATADKDRSLRSSDTESKKKLSSRGSHSLRLIHIR